MRVICLDLDEALLDTMNSLFLPVIIRAAAVSGKSVAETITSINRVSGITFTFETWFLDLGIPENKWAGLEDELRSDLAVRAPNCLFEGVRDLLETLKFRGCRLVLITAGHAGYQMWKFSLLGLDHLFEEEDRHFVPMTGSKAAAIEPYLDSGEITFIDDSPKWLLEVINKGWPVRCIRTRWPKTTNEAQHIDDGRHWQTARTAAEILKHLEGGM